MNWPVNDYLLNFLQAPANPESSVAPLNLNDDMISDAPNSSAKFPDVDGGSFTSSLSQGMSWGSNSINSTYN